MSPDAKGDSQNLRASPYAGKQAHWGDKKVWWFIVLAQGKVHVEVMPPGWTQNGDGQAQMVSLLPAILRRMLGVSPLSQMLCSLTVGLASSTHPLAPYALSMWVHWKHMGSRPGLVTTANGSLQTWLTSCCMRQQWHG